MLMMSPDNARYFLLSNTVFISAWSLAVAYIGLESGTTFERYFDSTRNQQAFGKVAYGVYTDGYAYAQT